MTSAHLDLDRIAHDLADRYSDSVSLAQAQAQVEAARAELEPTSRHPEFLGILIERRARDLLESSLESRGAHLHAVPTVLFVSEHNSGRSQMAAAFAEHFGGDHVHVQAAGSRDAGFVNPLVERAMDEVGVPFDHVFSAERVSDLAHSADVVVEMGAHVDELPGRAYVVWPVPDPHGAPMDVVRTVRDDIAARVKDLLADLGVPQP